jgi:hypothetical protein
MKRHYRPVLLALLAAFAACAAWSQSARPGGSSAGGAAPGGPAAARGGAQRVQGGAVPGFGCAGGGTWGYQSGELTCITSPPPWIGGISGKWVFVRVPSQGGWITSPAVQIVGENNDIRIDALTQTGVIVSSCYLYSATAPCNAAALTGTANGSYQDTLELPDVKRTLHFAHDLLANGLPLGGSSHGTNGSDNYVVSASLDTANNLTVEIAGYFTDVDTAASSSLVPRFARLVLSSTTLQSAGNGAVFDANSWTPIPQGG